MGKFRLKKVAMDKSNKHKNYMYRVFEHIKYSQVSDSVPESNRGQYFSCHKAGFVQQ